ncbi:MAG: metallophosphoesterase [Armatimonadetes bacterium]|nr:metallophosphoesterase [Armatimonadota bacterium]
MGERKRLTRRQVLQRGLAGTSAIASYSFLLEPNWLELVRRDVTIKGLGKGLDGFKIGLVSDLHVPRFIDREFVHSAMDLLAAEKPDVFCLPGDVYEGVRNDKVVSLKGFFDHYSAPYGLVATLGNHDYRLGERAVASRIRDDTPFKVLLNDHVPVERDGAVLALGGCNDLRWGRPDVAKTFHGVDPKVPRVMLAHNPDICEEWRGDTRVDLALCGHTHGGQIKLLPWYAPVTNSRYGQKYREGLVQGKVYRAYVTRGLARQFHCRLMSRPEVTLLTLRSG